MMKKWILLLIMATFLVACGSAEDSAATMPDDRSTSDTEHGDDHHDGDEDKHSEGDEHHDDADEGHSDEMAMLDHNMSSDCVSEYDETADYFPEKAAVTHSEGFTVEYHNNYKVVTVLTPYSGATDPVQYVLVQCGTPAPDGVDGTVIEVPIDSIVAMSTTYLPALDALGLLDALVGVDTTLYATNEVVQSMAIDGELVEIGSGSAVNIEAAIELDPDLIMTSASGSADYDSHPKLEEAGLTVALNSDYLDTNPLGRAEWIDFVALFFNKEAAAEAVIAEIAAEYDDLVALTADVAERPTVFSNTPYDGTWYMPGGNSYVAQLFEDAGANYLWADDESTGSLYLDFETVFDQAAAADAWLNIGFFDGLSDLAAADERFAEFAAYENANVFNNDALTNDSGGNDYYESGALYSNVVLKDLIKILHPDLLPDHELVYYRAVE